MKEITPDHTVKDAIDLWDSLNTRLPEPPYTGPPYSRDREPGGKFWAALALAGVIAYAAIIYLL